MTIQPARVTFERDKANELYRDHKKHLHYAKPIEFARSVAPEIKHDALATRVRV